MNIRKATEADWRQVQNSYVDMAGDALPRNFSNAAGTGFYKDSSNRNDITEIKVVHDSKNLYFMIKTVADITAHNNTDLNWMNILIGNRTKDDSFAGYQYIINRMPSANGNTSIEKSVGGYNWKLMGKVKYSVKGNLMQLAVPLSALGLKNEKFSLEFKIADNVTHPADIMDYYISGDSAPVGRLSFSY